MKLQHSNKLLLRKVLKLGRCRNLATWPSVIWAIRWTIYPSFPMFFLINILFIYSNFLMLHHWLAFQEGFSIKWVFRTCLNNHLKNWLKKCYRTKIKDVAK
jgi:hypothetical protein